MSSAHPTPETGPEHEPAQPQLQDRWWWSGTYRGVLGAVVVGFQSDVLASGEAQVWNWVVAGLGAVVAVWGLVTVLTAYRSR